MNLRQGDTTTVLMRFSESIGDRELVVAIYNKQHERVYSASLLADENIELIGENVYRVVIPHSVTRGFVGLYWMDLMLKSAEGTEYVNVGETPIKMHFKPAKIAEDL